MNERGHSKIAPYILYRPYKVSTICSMATYLYSLATIAGTLATLKLVGVNLGHRKTEPPLYQSWTILGPYDLFKNPLKFAAEARKDLGDIFSCWMLNRKITFVFGKENVLKMTDAKNDELNFEDAYRAFLHMAFGEGVLTRHAAPPQVGVLKKYLADAYLDAYLQPTEALATKIISTTLGESGATDLQKLLRDVSFNVGTRNFLGDDFLEALKDYDYQSIFNGFEMGFRFVAEYLPLIGKLKGKLDGYKAPSPFAAAIFKLATKERDGESRNMFEEIIAHRSESDGPTMNDDQVLVNLLKIFVFGSAFNGYNMMSYFLRTDVGNKSLWEKLREEQHRVDETYGPIMTGPKRAAMTLLYRSLMTAMFRNTFPFLLRHCEEDYEIGGYIIPKGHTVAYSPQLEHDGSDYVNDQQFNLIFGKGTHACPAKKYSINSMMVILSVLIKNYDFELVHAEPMVNTRLVTFPAQPEIIVRYKRVRSMD